MLDHDCIGHHANYQHKPKRHDYQIVEVPQHGHEVRNEIDR
jgi:hypothetical protein